MIPDESCWVNRRVFRFPNHAKHLIALFLVAMNCGCSNQEAKMKSVAEVISVEGKPTVVADTATVEGGMLTIVNPVVLDPTEVGQDRFKGKSLLITKTPLVDLDFRTLVAGYLAIPSSHRLPFLAEHPVDYAEGELILVTVDDTGKVPKTETPAISKVQIKTP